MILEGFYGRNVELREDLLYYPVQELWVRPLGTDGELEFGVTHAGVILVSGFTYLEYVAEIGNQVEKGDDILFVETYKAMINIEAPISGRITKINDDLKGEKVSLLENHYYEKPLFAMVPKEPIDLKSVFLDVAAYQQALLGGTSDHCGAGARVQRRGKNRKDQS